LGHEEHRRQGSACVRVAILTISDTRTAATDMSGATLKRLLEGAGHSVSRHAILPDDPEQVREWVRARLAEPDCDGVVTTGGTGIAPRDSTFEALASMVEKPLPGFGELFRMLSYQEIGSAAMLSRALGGVASGRFLFCLPGSPQAVTLALLKLILPELGHLVGEMRRNEKR